MIDLRLTNKLTIVLLVLAAKLPPAHCQAIAITDVTVISPRTRSVLAHQTVVITGGFIKSVQASSISPPSSAQRIDGKDKFLIPGLWDAHVHLTKTGILSLPLFVANGITGVRDMGSDFHQIASWRSQIEAGKLVGPRIKTAGQMLESRANIERMKREGTIEPVDRIRIGVANPQEARAAVARLAHEGVDHIKMRTTPDLETFLAVGEEARRYGLPFAAHPIATPEGLMRAHLRSVEHFLALPPIEGSPAERRALFQQLARAGLFMSDTSVNLDVLISLPYASIKRLIEDRTGKLDARRKYVCGYLVADWREQVEELKDPDTVKDYSTLRSELPDIYRDNREMYEKGMNFLAGTDVAVLLMYPGFSLHDELKKLVQDVHLSTMDVLRIATSNTAMFYKEEQKYGAIAAGQAADLVLLNNNPLSDISNTTKIAGVMTNGRWFNRTALDHLLQQVEEQCNAAQ